MTDTEMLRLRIHDFVYSKINITGPCLEKAIRVVWTGSTTRIRPAVPW